MIVSDLQLYNMKRCERLDEVIECLESDLSGHFKTNVSKDRTTLGVSKVCPRSLNTGYKEVFSRKGYRSYRPYSFCEIDFFKERVGVEIQFGKMDYIVYDIFSKFRPCHYDDILDFGIEVVPSRFLNKRLSHGVGCYDLELTRLEKCKVDVPVALVALDVGNEQELNSQTIEEFFA